MSQSLPARIQYQQSLEDYNNVPLRSKGLISKKAGAYSKIRYCAAAALNAAIQAYKANKV